MSNYAIELYLSIIGLVLFFYLGTKIFTFLQETLKWKRVNKKKLSLEQIGLIQKSLRPYTFLSEDEKLRLHKKILYFLEYKSFYAIQEFEITDEVKLLIAAQACLLIVNVDCKIYPKLYSIYISHLPFIEKENPINLNTLMPIHVPRLGESWKDGPVVLAWSSIKEGMANWQDGHNVVLHEFTHQLDSYDGDMDGTPILNNEASYKKWEIFMTKEFLSLRKKLRSHQKSDIDFYGATNEAEFFAVAVEHFFSKSKIFSEKHPELYQIFSDYFKLDPANWIF